MNKMNTPPIFLMLAVIFIIMTSCAAVVEFQLEHPPLVDMRNINKITVIPLEWNETGEYAYLASEATKALSAGVKKANMYTYVDPSVLKSANPTRYWEYVDVYVTGGIQNVASYDSSETRIETYDDKTERKEYVTRTVTVDIEYTYIRAIDSAILGVFHKTERESVTFENTDRSSNWFVNFLLAVVAPRGTPSAKIARSAIKKFSNGMNREIVPWTSMEKRRVEEHARKDPAFKEARRLVKRKKYSEALALYEGIYENTGSIVAGYNAALLLEAKGRFADALALLEALHDRIAETGVNSPPYIRDEIENVKKIMNELEILEDYKKRRTAKRSARSDAPLAFGSGFASASQAITNLSRRGVLALAAHERGDHGAR